MSRSIKMVPVGYGVEANLRLDLTALTFTAEVFTRELGHIQSACHVSAQDAIDEVEAKVKARQSFQWRPIIAVAIPRSPHRGEARISVNRKHVAYADGEIVQRPWTGGKVSVWRSKIDWSDSGEPVLPSHDRGTWSDNYYAEYDEELYLRLRQLQDELLDVPKRVPGMMGLDK